MLEHHFYCCTRAGWHVKMLMIGASRRAWGIARVLAVIVLLPLFIIGLAWIGLFYMAIAVLIIAGIVALIGGVAEA